MPTPVFGILVFLASQNLVAPLSSSEPVLAQVWQPHLVETLHLSSCSGVQAMYPVASRSQLSTSFCQRIITCTQVGLHVPACYTEATTEPFCCQSPHPTKHFQHWHRTGQPYTSGQPSSKPSQAVTLSTLVQIFAFVHSSPDSWPDFDYWFITQDILLTSTVTVRVPHPSIGLLVRHGSLYPMTALVMPRIPWSSLSLLFISAMFHMMSPMPLLVVVILGSDVIVRYLHMIQADVALAPMY